jgi:hypothetical protein
MEKFKNNIARTVLDNYEYNTLYNLKTTGKSLIFTSAFLNTIKIFKLENVCSIYNQDYICKVKAIEIYNNELRVHIQERGNMSLGSLQNPKFSKLIEEKSNKNYMPSSMKFYVADKDREYDGYLSFDLKKLKDGENYLFEYGYCGYNAVPIFSYTGRGEINVFNKQISK